MAQEVATLNNSNFCSVYQVDKDISFVLDNRDINFALSVPTEKYIGMSQKTYPQKHPLSYLPPVALLETKTNNNNSGISKAKRTSLKNLSKDTLAMPSQKIVRRKRPADHELTSKTPASRKIRKRETSGTKVMSPPIKMNGRITSKYPKTSHNINSIPSPDSDIEIIQVIEHSTSTAIKRDTNNSSNGKERNKERYNDTQKKKNSKSLPSMLELYPTNDDVPITEADIAPVIPSNSVIPDTSVSETNQDVVVKLPSKCIIPSGIGDVSSIQIVETNGAKDSNINCTNANLLESDAKVSRERNSSKSRELKNLYANLNEIRWAKEKDFKEMLSMSENVCHRHSERITAKAVDQGKNMRRLKAASMSGKPLNKQKVFAKKNSAKLALQRAKYGRLKPKLMLKKSLKSKPALMKTGKVIRKSPVKSNKRLIQDTKTKTVQPKVGIKTKATVRLKPKCLDASAGKHSKIVNISSKSKLGNSSQIVGKSNLSSALKKSLKTEHEAQVISKSSSNSKVVRKFEYSNEVKLLGKNLGDSKVYTTAVKKGSKLRVRVEPLEHTNLWNSDFCDAFSKYVIEQSSSQMETKSKDSIKAMFEELFESWYTNTSESTKLPKKKKPEEEILRSSVRQSEGAFRYKEIVVKKHENYMQFILVPNAVKQNSLSIEAMKELRDAFLLAKKDPNCRAVLLNSSGTFFCTGIDLSQLVGSNKKQIAEEMASTIKELVLTLSTFTKPVVAAVNGTTVGFGVTLLTLCDVVLASDKATFCIPATRLGYLPEGAITLTLPQVVGSTVATELLLYGRRLTADQALRHGLVSEVLWHSNLMNEVVPRVRVIVSQPLQVMEATKTMVRCQLWDRLKFHMEREWRLLPPLWLDAQCQSNIKKALQTGWLID